MNDATSTPEICKYLLKKWRKHLMLTNLEISSFSNELKDLDHQLDRLLQKRFQITVYGRVGVGKSSLLNAIVGKNFFKTDVSHGSTKDIASVNWDEKFTHIEKVNLLDTPGIDEENSTESEKAASKIALSSDLILFVLDSDVTTVELNSLEELLRSGKPVLLALNRCDQWKKNELKSLIKSIRKRLPYAAKKLPIEVVAAAPREAQLMPNMKVRSNIASTSKVATLRTTLMNLIEDQGELLMSLNALQQADNFYHSLKQGRLKRRKLEAQSLIGKFATLKASGVAINPILFFDLATGVALDTALIVQLSKLYGLDLKGKSAKQLLKKLSLHNTFLGGAQIGIQFLLAIVQHLLLVITPFTGGLSLAPAGPIALLQALIAVHTTKVTGRLAAKELLRGTYRKGIQPSSILKGLAKIDPQVHFWLNNWPYLSRKEGSKIQALIP